ncbi:MAG: hypothetical protein WBK26_12125 [Burkholderiaceae bacterium]
MKTANTTNTITITTTITQRQQLEAQRTNLQDDLAAAQAALAQAEAAAAPLLRQREARLASRLIVRLPAPDHEEAATLRTHSEAENRVVAIEDALRDLERELATLDGQDRAKSAGKSAKAAMADAQTLVKVTGEHRARVQQLRAVKQAELDAVLRQQQAAEEATARAAVAALLGQTAPTPAEVLDEGAVPRLEAVINQLNIELARAEREAEAAADKLSALESPILQGELATAQEAFTKGLEALLPHLHNWTQASGRLGWGWRIAERVDLPTVLRAWRQANGLPT